MNSQMMAQRDSVPGSMMRRLKVVAESVEPMILCLALPPELKHLALHHNLSFTKSALRISPHKVAQDFSANTGVSL
jgi:hypothetical protein